MSRSPFAYLKLVRTDSPTIGVGQGTLKPANLPVDGNHSFPGGKRVTDGPDPTLRQTEGQAGEIRGGDGDLCYRFLAVNRQRQIQVPSTVKSVAEVSVPPLLLSNRPVTASCWNVTYAEPQQEGSGQSA